MDFLPKTANLTGGDTRKAPKHTQFSKSRHTPGGKGPPHAITHIPTYHSQTLSILSNQNTHCQIEDAAERKRDGTDENTLDHSTYLIGPPKFLSGNKTKQISKPRVSLSSTFQHQEMRS